MTKDDIARLALMARIEVAGDEADGLAADITSILGYVSQINAITANAATGKQTGAVANVLREDGEPHAAGLYTEDILGAAPKRTGQYFEVKKILGDAS